MLLYLDIPYHPIIYNPHTRQTKLLYVKSNQIISRYRQLYYVLSIGHNTHNSLENISIKGLYLYNDNPHFYPLNFLIFYGTNKPDHGGAIKRYLRCHRVTRVTAVNKHR